MYVIAERSEALKSHSNEKKWTKTYVKNTLNAIQVFFCFSYGMIGQAIQTFCVFLHGMMDRPTYTGGVLWNAQRLPCKEVLELFLANRWTGKFYYAFQRDANMPKMSHMMINIQQNLKLQFQETLRIHSVPKRLGMKKKSHDKQNWEAFCFPTTALAATNCKQSKTWHDGCDISAVIDVSLQCILGQPTYKCRYEGWDAETVDFKNSWNYNQHTSYDFL